MIYLTSDWHIGHEKVLEMSNRPFKDMEHMKRVLINNYNSTVREGDVCYFLGDMGWNRADVLREVIGQLNGTKILIQGNHDKNGLSCFDLVLQGAKIKIGGKIVTLSHYPLLGVKREDTAGMRESTGEENWHGEPKYLDIGFEDRWSISSSWAYPLT